MRADNKWNILIVTGDADIGTLYNAILMTEGHSARLCTYEQANKVSLEPVPQLIVLHLDLLFFSEILAFLARVYHTCTGSRPVLLLIGHKDWSDPRIESMVDMRITSPVAPEHFKEIVENLLRIG